MAAIALLGLAGSGLGAPRPRTQPRPRTWPPALRQLFVADPFAHYGLDALADPGVVGAGPGDSPVGPSNTASGSPRQVAPPAPSGSERSAGQSDWADLASATTIENEIKRQVQLLTETTASDAAFKSGSFVEARRSFALLTLLFRVVEQMPPPVRWQRDAVTAWADCLKAADACQSASDEAFARAAGLAASLADLMQGQPLPPADAAADEPIPPRVAIMQRWEMTSESLGELLSAERTWQRKRDELVQESELLALLAHWIQQPRYEYADDESYLEQARRLEQAARELRQAVEAKDFSAAESAWSQAQKSCADCHRDFRT